LESTSGNSQSSVLIPKAIKRDVWSESPIDMIKPYIIGNIGIRKDKIEVLLIRRY
jgi:hypothetical protein